MCAEAVRWNHSQLATALRAEKSGSGRKGASELYAASQIYDFFNKPKKKNQKNQ